MHNSSVRWWVFLGILLALGTLLVVPDGLGAVVSAETAVHDLYFPIVRTERSAEYFGVGHDLVGTPWTELDSVIAKMVDSGVRSVRMPLRWTLLEPAQGQFAWRNFDRVIDKLNQANIDIVGIFGTVPEWANGQSAANTPANHAPTSYPPTEIEYFSDMVTEVVDRYGDRIGSWVVFNEPNSDQFWRPAPDAEAYVDYLCTAHAIIKQQDPDLIVVGGALVGNGASIGREGRDLLDFLPLMYEAGALGCYDVLAIHPYLHPVIYDIADLQESLDTTRLLMIEAGDFRPIWINEIGWATSPNAWGLPTVSEAEVANWLEQVYTQLNGAERIYWYNMRDVAIGPNNPEFNFGLVRHDFTHKPAYNVFKDLAK